MPIPRVDVAAKLYVCPQGESELIMAWDAFTIRHATPADAAAIAEIYNEAVRTTTATFDTHPQTSDQRRAWLAAHGPRHPVFVAVAEGQVIGWAALTPWSERPAYLQTAETSFYVAEHARGQGVGRALKSRLLEEAERLEYHTLIARVAEGSEASVHLNQSMGFQMVGTMREVGFKFDRWLDVHIMQLMLPRGSGD